MGETEKKGREPSLAERGFMPSAVVLGTSRVGIIGEQPTIRAVVEGREPLAGRPTDFLGRVVGISGDEFRELVGRVNLMETPGVWRLAAARRKAEYLQSEVLPMLPWDAVVLLGRRVQRAFSLDGVPPVGFQTKEQWGWPPDVAWIPHPSGLNRWWNESENRECAADLLRSLLWPK